MLSRGVLGCWGIAVALLVATPAPARASWLEIFSEDFSADPSARWQYAGATNGQGLALMRHDAANQRMHAEWDQAHLFSGTGDPYTLLNSRVACALPRTLTDRDTFRLRATLVIEPGSYPDTTEYFQIGNAGLFNLSQMGPDRTLTDNFSGNTNLLKDGSDFIEFSYFINNAFGGPNINGVIGAHIDGVDFDYTTGTNYTQTAMGEGHWLPDATPLYLELTYYGSATGALARCANSAIYTEPARTNLFVVNGVTMSYWTEPFSPGKTFSLTDVAFFNYPSWNFGGPNGTGTGSFDDVSVELNLAEGTFSDMRAAVDGIALTWASVSGATYTVLSAPEPSAANWITTSVMQAGADFLSITSPVVAPQSVWGIRFEHSP